MNIRFHNLGKIKETELDLRPLTVIIGPNNTNKTYIAYSVYGLWQQLRKGIRSTSFQFENHFNSGLSINVEVLRKAFIATVKSSIGEFIDDLGSFYQDSSRFLFSGTNYEISITPEEFRSALRSLTVHGIHMSHRVWFRFSLEQDLLVLSRADMPTGEVEATSEETPNGNALRLEADLLLQMLLRRQLFALPYLLPAERNAFVITYKVLANRRLKLMLDAQRRIFSSRQTSQLQMDLLREAGEIRYPQPIEDFLEFLFEIESDIGSKPKDHAGTLAEPSQRLRRSPRSGLGKLASEIEQGIQDGNKIHYRQTVLGGQEIMVDVGNGLTIDLYNASSSIKQLAPLLLYLRYRAAKGDLLIIDEPEMNLHPESQAKLLEVLAMLVNQGVYVLLTTHSPYLMSHLNNLTQAEESSEKSKRRQAKALYLGNTASLLQMDQVSAYEMRDGQLQTLKDPDYGIRWDTLSDVSAELQQKYFNIHE